MWAETERQTPTLAMSLVFLARAVGAGLGTQCKVAALPIQSAGAQVGHREPMPPGTGAVVSRHASGHGTGENSDPQTPSCKGVWGSFIKTARQLW